MSTLCPNCSSETIAEIKQIMLDKSKVERPVWYCQRCDLSIPTKKDDRVAWVNRFEWLPPSLIYGLEMSSYRCLGCEKDGVMYAVVEHLLGSTVFPFDSELLPAWCCYQCGFTDRARRIDKYTWADAYHLWY